MFFPKAMLAPCYYAKFSKGSRRQSLRVMLGCGYEHQLPEFTPLASFHPGQYSSSLIYHVQCDLLPCNSAEACPDLVYIHMSSPPYSMWMYFILTLVFESFYLVSHENVLFWLTAGIKVIYSLGNNCAKYCVRYRVDKWAKTIQVQFPVYPKWLSMAQILHLSRTEI